MYGYICIREREDGGRFRNRMWRRELLDGAAIVCKSENKRITPLFISESMSKRRLLIGHGRCRAYIMTHYITKSIVYHNCCI